MTRSSSETIARSHVKIVSFIEIAEERAWVSIEEIGPTGDLYFVGVVVRDEGAQMAIAIVRGVESEDREPNTVVVDPFFHSQGR